MTQPPQISDAMIEALAPFIRAARYFEYYIPEVMPELTFPVHGSTAGALDGFPQFNLTVDDFKALQAALAHSDAQSEAVAWESIETAPKDGTAFWVWWPHWYHFPLTAYWDTFQLHLADSNQPAKPWELGQPHGPALWTPMQLPSTPPAQDHSSDARNMVPTTAQGDLVDQEFREQAARLLMQVTTDPQLLAELIRRGHKDNHPFVTRLTALRAGQGELLKRAAARIDQLEGDFGVEGELADEINEALANLESKP